jgi:hypothetical protein
VQACIPDDRGVITDLLFSGPQSGDAQTGEELYGEKGGPPWMR